MIFERIMLLLVGMVALLEAARLVVVKTQYINFTLVLSVTLMLFAMLSKTVGKIWLANFSVSIPILIIITAAYLVLFFSLENLQFTKL